MGEHRDLTILSVLFFFPQIERKKVFDVFCEVTNCSFKSLKYETFLICHVKSVFCGKLWK